MSELSLSKHRLYELYWGKELSLREIASRCDVPSSTLAEWMDKYGIPTYGNLSRDSWIALQTVVAVTTRRRIYELYWTEGLSTSETAHRCGCSRTCVRNEMYRQGIPRRDPTQCIDPELYCQPRQHTQEQTTPTEDTDTTTSLPDDPSPERYLTEYDCYDKQKIYELYWGHGHDIKSTLARLDADISPSTLRHQMDKLGIPRRNNHGTNQYKRQRSWLPRDGVPPMYEWETEKEPRKRTDKHMGIWRTPNTATGD